MSGMLSRVGGALEGLLAGHTPGPAIGFLPEDRCSPAGVAGKPSPRTGCTSRSGHTSCSSRTTESSGRRMIRSPSWPSDSSTTARQSPSRVSSVPAWSRQRAAPAGAPGEAMHGTVLKDTLIAGPYPYRGGDVDVTVRLYAAERDNKARAVLRTAERLTGAIADPGGIATFEKTTEAVVSAIESVFGLTPMRYLAGARLAARKATLPFKSGYVAVWCRPPRRWRRSVFPTTGCATTLAKAPAAGRARTSCCLASTAWSIGTTRADYRSTGSATERFARWPMARRAGSGRRDT